MIKERAVQNMLVSFLSIIVGILLLAADSNEILRFVFVTIGIISIVSGISSILRNKYIMDEKERNTSLVISIITIAIGVLLIYQYNQIVHLIVGVFLIALPLYKIIVFKEHKEVFKRELSKIIIGVIVLICGFASIMNVILDILGIIVIILALIYMIYNIYIVIKNNKAEKLQQEENEVIDV